MTAQRPAANVCHQVKRTTWPHRWPNCLCRCAFPCCIWFEDGIFPSACNALTAVLMVTNPKKFAQD